MTRPFTRLQISAAFANFADGMSLVAFPLLAAAFTSSPLAIGAISAARSLPWLLASLHVGALIDRRGAARLLFGSNAARCVLFFGLAVLVLFPTSLFLACLGVVAFVVGVLEVVADNSAQTLLPKVVPPERLPKANARMQLIENAGLNLLGAPVASALMTLHLAAPLVAIATKYSVAAAALRTLVSGGGSATPDTDGLLAGWLHVRRSRALFTLAMTTSLMNVALGGAPAIMVLYVDQQLHAPSWTYGLLLTVLAVGTVLGALVVPRALARTSETFMLRFALVAMPVPMFILALATEYWVAAVAMFVWGALEIAWGIVAVSYRQEVVPYERLGRVNAVYRMMAWGSIPVGALLTGLLGELVGISGAYLALTAVLCSGWLVSLTIRPEVLDLERQLVKAHAQGEAA